MLGQGDNSTTSLFYAVQMISFVIWCVCAWRMVQRQKEFQHNAWQVKATQLFAGYVLCEFFRIVDCAYTEMDTGLIYSIWGVVPWWVRLYAWMVRDVLMFRGICVYLEHALVWTHCYLQEPVPKTLLTAQMVFCYFGNAVFLVAGTLYMVQNDQFYQPLCALGQVPPNMVVAMACYYLHKCLKRVPDCEELRHATIINYSLLVAASTCLLVFPPWAGPRLMELYSRPLAAISTVPHGSSMLFAAAPCFKGTGAHLDLFLESVELSVGWCGCVGLMIKPMRRPEAGEPLVLSPEDVGKAITQAQGKKSS